MHISILFHVKEPRIVDSFIKLRRTDAKHKAIEMIARTSIIRYYDAKRRLKDITYRNSYITIPPSQQQHATSTTKLVCERANLPCRYFMHRHFVLCSAASGAASSPLSNFFDGWLASVCRFRAPLMNYLVPLRLLASCFLLICLHAREACEPKH